MTDARIGLAVDDFSEGGRDMHRKWTTWLAFAGVAGCGGGDSPTGNNGNNNGSPNDPGYPEDWMQAVTVDILDNQYSPKSVVVAPGATVTFHWVGTAGHSVTPSGRDTFSPTAGVSYPPKDLTVTFNAVGSYSYYCLIHGAPDGYGKQGSMNGTIIVR
jgi:plastocyanin